MKIEYIYPFFIFAGFIIIGILLYLKYLTNKTIKAILELIDLNSRLDCDVHTFLTEISPLLRKLSINEFFYTITYLNTRIEKDRVSGARPLEKEITRDDYNISLGIVPKVARGERRFLSLIALEVLVMLIEMDVLIKIKVINEAFYRFSRLQTFILHDVKNLAQFIGSLAYNANHLESADRSERFIDYLKESLPVATRRADKIISLLEMRASTGIEALPRQRLNVRNLLEKLAKYYKLDFTLAGEATIDGEEHKIVPVLDTLLKNVSDKSLQEPEVRCHIEISEEAGQVKVAIADTGTPIIDPERIFQPFHSSKPGGLGIGLFHARHLLDSIRGKITGRNTPNGVAFEVFLPKN
jgi:signal transduction histidine kinase